jgi:hypothetical protein
VTWFEEQRSLTALLLAIRDARGDLPDLPFTPPCHHMRPHETRAITTRDALIDYTIFQMNGWERAGYCWHYVPAFLHEWFGCGPSQTFFQQASA